MADLKKILATESLHDFERKSAMKILDAQKYFDKDELKRLCSEYFGLIDAVRSSGHNTLCNTNLEYEITLIQSRIY